MACERPGWPVGLDPAGAAAAAHVALAPAASGSGRAAQERLASPDAPGVRELEALGERVVRVEDEVVHPVIHARLAIAVTIASGPPTAMRRRWRSRRRAASPPLPRGTSSHDPPTGALSPSEQQVDATRSGRLALGVVPRVPGRPCRARAAPRQDRDGTRHRARCASLDRGEMCDADAHPRDRRLLRARARAARNARPTRSGRDASLIRRLRALDIPLTGQDRAPEAVRSAGRP
jgi:hypothetical protein